MNDIAIQFLGLLVFLALIAASYWRWIRPHNINLETKGVLLLITVTMIGGLVGSTGWWFDVPEAFSWDLPPLASRMLAAAGWAFGAATFMTLQRPTKQRIRLVLLMLAVYLIPLAIAIVLFHLDRFNPDAPITYAFFIIVTALIVPTLWYLVRTPVVLVESQPNVLPTRPVWIWLNGVRLLMGLWGFALLITDSGPINLIWVWPGDLLTSRLIAVMLLTIAVAAVYSLQSADLARVTLITMTVYGFGAALANLWNVTTGKPVQPLYAIVFGIMGLVSLWMYRQSSTE
ncbi:MAG: hypothetical protein GC179_06140 [Anaerolineaceae bacterium]|nr:hypothetical protein [Anaerolineaceae bacterium]